MNPSDCGLSLDEINKIRMAAKTGDVTPMAMERLCEDLMLKHMLLGMTEEAVRAHQALADGNPLLARRHLTNALEKLGEVGKYEPGLIGWIPFLCDLAGALWEAARS